MSAIQVFEAFPDQTPARFTSLPRFDAAGHFGAAGRDEAPPPGGSSFTLRRSGGRPVSFTGQLLGEHGGRRGKAALWHELALYRTDAGRHVAEIRVCHAGEAAQDQHHVSIAASFDAALGVFESYDPRLDVEAEFDLDDRSMAPAELMVQAAALRYRIADAVAQYRATLGTFLAAVDAG